MKRELINVSKPFAMLAAVAITFAYPGLAQQTFPSAEQATQSLFQAVQDANVRSIDRILGGRSELASSGDVSQDKVDRKLFVQKYLEMHRLGREPDGSAILYIGAENWPFPIPLVDKNGTWRFDSEAGIKEVLFRRIGENELTAIEICHEFIAEKQHRLPSRYADPVGSFAASLLARASSPSADNSPALFQGYYFRLLEAPSTWNLIAYPAAYRSSGVMTFVVSANGTVYEKDRGESTSVIASTMAAFHIDSSWHDASD